MQWPKAYVRQPGESVLMYSQQYGKNLVHWCHDYGWLEAQPGCIVTLGDEARGQFINKVVSLLSGAYLSNNIYSFRQQL